MASTTNDPIDPDGAALGQLLTDLVDDPDAPTTSVSALSVIAAAKAAAAGSVGPTDPDGSTGTDPGPPAAPAVLPAVRSATDVAVPDRPSTGELHVLAVQQDADRRARRRRTGLIYGLVAACGVGIAAVVIPLAVTRSSGDTSAAAPQASVNSQAAGAVAAPSADRAAEGGAAADAEGAPAAGATPTVESPATIDPANPDANRPPPGESALTQALPVPGGTAPADNSGAGGGVSTSCWPVLSDAASAALVGALPPGAFGAPGLLGLGCPADPVAGAQLAGTTPDTQLVVRVVRADPGACAQSASETGARCVARGGDQYVANDAGNLSVYAYGNGYEVEVGGRPATGIAPIPSGLTAEQLSAAAAAVLGALG